jgi:hypothetical protein
MFGVFFQQFVENLAGFGVVLREEILLGFAELLRAFAAGVAEEVVDAFGWPANESFADRNDAAICDGALLGNRMRFVVPASGLQQWNNVSTACIGFAGHASTHCVLLCRSCDHGCRSLGLHDAKRAGDGQARLGSYRGSPARANGLPVDNRRYGRLATCATLPPKGAGLGRMRFPQGGSAGAA